MARPWLEYYNKSSSSNQHSHPPVMILMTDIGWNHPNQSIGISATRSIRETELFTGVINHPWFHPTAWADIRSNRMEIRTDVRYYVFVDGKQCSEGNYPIYGGGVFQNLDSSHNRSALEVDARRNLVDACANSDTAKEILQHRLFLDSTASANNTKLIIFDCGGKGPPSHCAKQTTRNHLPISIAAISATFPIINEERDQGLIPPAGVPIPLSTREEEDIRSCDAETNRDFKLLYVGNYRVGNNKKHTKKHIGGARGAYKKMHNNKNILIRRHIRPPKHKESILANVFRRTIQRGGVQRSILANMSYPEFMKRTSFGLAPRGDDKFSYRFTEVLSAGTIPVYHADDFVFPFRPEVVDWNKCAVLLPEKDGGKPALEILNAISIETRCEMRNYCYFGIYKKYVETGVGIIDGLVRGLDELAKGNRKPLPGVRCNATSIANLDCNHLR